jgi:DNA-binding MarR family transcriptional regulator
MSGRIANEIKQNKPMPLEVEAFLNLARTTDFLQRAPAELLKDKELSPTQYNVLRILRGAGNAGLPCREIGARMVTRDPDITRLLDRMEESELVTRARDEQDRRVITVKISEKGRKIANELDDPLLELHRRQMAGLTQRELKDLVELLERLRKTEA